MYKKELLNGNSAIARGFYEAGGVLATAYPGTPSADTIRYIEDDYPDIYAEYSTNEKVAIEVSIGASIAGGRVLTNFKQLGLNIALDPLMTFTQSTINGGFLVYVSDDPGLTSTQNEQDSRVIAKYANMCLLCPSNIQEMKDYVKIGLDISENFDATSMLRATTPLCTQEGVVTLYKRADIAIKEFIPDQTKYCMFPPYANKAQYKMKESIAKLEEYAYNSPLNTLEICENSDTLIITAGFMYPLIKEINPPVSIYKLGIVYPISTKKVKELSTMYKKIIVCEELLPFIEDELKIKGVDCKGKEYFSFTGQLQVQQIAQGLIEAGVIKEYCNIDKETCYDNDEDFNNIPLEEKDKEIQNGENYYYNDLICNKDNLKNCANNECVRGSCDINNECLNKSIPCLNIEAKPVETLPRKPVFYSGCPHRPIFDILKKTKTFAIGDIGCSTIGMYYPWNVNQINMNMGACVGIMKGFQKVMAMKNEDQPIACLLGDGGFYHSGILNIVNLLHKLDKNSKMTVIILDNGSTALTGWQGNPGSGLYNYCKDGPPGGSNRCNAACKSTCSDSCIEISSLLNFLGFKDVTILDQFEVNKTEKIITEVLNRPNLSFIIVNRPCLVAFDVQKPSYFVDPNKCIACRNCVKLNCEPIRMVKYKNQPTLKAYIDPVLCTGCSVCAQVCPVQAINQCDNGRTI